ncbi:MAG: restriction endonuclease subunit S [Bacteroidota bacterium]
MVDGNLAYKYQEVSEEIDYSILPDPVKHTSVSLTDIFNNKLRLEANAFNLEAKVAKEKVLANKYGVVNLWSPEGLVDTAFHRPRFKRIYVDHAEIPFFQPSSITEVYPKPARYISAKTDVDLKSLKVEKGMLLMTVSGTIGKVAIAGKKLDQQVFSHDLLRLKGKGSYDTGFIYTYFLTETGQHILQSNNYGAVIKHIEPEHLHNIIIPNAPEALKRRIHNLVIESYELRDQSNDLIDEAENILIQELQLPSIENLQVDHFDNLVELRNYSVKLSELSVRLDGSYHVSEAKSIIDILNQSANEVTFIGDNKISSEVLHPNRFKRVYASADNGVPFFGGKNLLDLNPTSGKYLALAQHEETINNELRVKENSLIVTRSGTIGKVALVPKHWHDWIGSDDLLRIYPFSRELAGYIFCWLNSPYGSLLLNRNVYGSVVDHIEVEHLERTEIPLLKNQNKQNEINKLVLKANDLRHQAHLKEQQSIKEMEDILNNKNESYLPIAAEPEGEYKSGKK